MNFLNKLQNQISLGLAEKVLLDFMKKNEVKSLNINLKNEKLDINFSQQDCKSLTENEFQEMKLKILELLNENSRLKEINANLQKTILGKKL